MKQLKSTGIKTMMSVLMLNLLSFAVFAQDSTGTSTSSTTTTMTSEETWYMQPWAWIVGAIILLLILFSLFSGRSSRATRDSVTYSKTVNRDEEV